MIIVTGAAGFIGSCLVGKLNQEGYNDIVVVDEYSNNKKNKNLEGKEITHKIDRNDFLDWFRNNHKQVQFVFHLGARTDTTEFNHEVFDELNFGYSQKIWDICVEFGLPLVYASSAATYGMGEYGYEDDHALVEKLTPLNPYGESKNNFDKWVLMQEEKPYFWAGLKFFNVYGPNEYHKGRMASVVFHAYNQIVEQGKLTLFRSHNPKYKDGEQLRDFVYVKDALEVCCFFMQQRKNSGLYNLGTGRARTFNDLALNTISNSNRDAPIEFIDTPEDIREKYQYFTEANITKLTKIGYNNPFHNLEDGIGDYVQNYLIEGKYY